MSQFPILSFLLPTLVRKAVVVCVSAKFFHHQFPRSIQDVNIHINALELLSVVVAIKLRAPKVTGLSVELLSDNTTCVAVINNQRSSTYFMQRCVRELWLVLALHNINLVVSPFAGKQNTLADALSRFHHNTFEERFRTLNSHLSLEEVIVEDHVFNFVVD